MNVLRSEQGLERRALAESAGVSYQTLASIEQGVRWPTDNALSSLASALGLPLSSLVTLRDDLALRPLATSETAMRKWLVQAASRLGRTTSASEKATALTWESESAQVLVEVLKRPDGSFGVLTRVHPHLVQRSTQTEPQIEAASDPRGEITSILSSLELLSPEQLHLVRQFIEFQKSQILHGARNP
jgi:transcriptional regulator with XRE-family HTH domain